MLRYIYCILAFLLIPIFSLHAEEIRDINVRDTTIGTTGVQNGNLENFINPIREFFISSPISGGEGLYVAFVSIAFQIKNFFIGIAIMFLIVGVLKLLFSSGGDEDVKKWRNNIIWISVGVFIMQISFSIWNTLIIKNNLGGINAQFGYEFWVNVFGPIVNLLQMLAGLGFIIMMLYAFYIIVTGGGDDEKLKKGKNTVIYAAVGFFLIRIPEALIRAIYGSPDCKTRGIFSYGTCEIEKQNLSGAIEIIGKIFNYFNTFLAILCVLLVIYAGWLVLISGGDEEKLKKAKNIVIYIVVGLFVLIASLTIFKFFILRG